jgi:hypothetical protein
MHAPSWGLAAAAGPPPRVGPLALALIMISQAHYIGLAATQEAFIVADHHYHTLQDFYDTANDDNNSFKHSNYTDQHFANNFTTATNYNSQNHFNANNNLTTTDYNYNLLGHQNQSSHCLVALPAIGPTQQGYGTGRPAICIGQRDVEMALAEAASRMQTTVAATAGTTPQTTSDRPSALEVIASAELVAQASLILAARFRLTRWEALYELPKIDAGNSPALARVCPEFLKSDLECLPDDQPLDSNKFRSLSGFCNNVLEKSWGSARSAMVRFLPPDYQDTIWAPRVAADGSPLPSARVVSFVLHQDTPECDNRNSMLGVVWGQFINHDINLGVRISDEHELYRRLDCCQHYQQPSPASAGLGGNGIRSNNDSDIYYQQQQQQYLRLSDCYPIEIPKGDPFYGYFGQKCMNFIRLLAGLQPGCSMGPVQAMNKHSSYLDGSSVYGSSASVLKRLRAHRGGLLRSQPVPTAIRTTTAAAAAVTGDALEARSSEPEFLVAIENEYGRDSATVPSYLMLNSGTYQQQPAPAPAQPLPQPQPQPQPQPLPPPPAPYARPMASGPAEPLFKDLLPANEIAPDVGCERRNRPKELYCFDSGDTRANEQIQLASLHTIMMREHNRLARQLAAVNPHWSDERLFQEARKIVGAQIQHITFNEFLPLVLGKEGMREPRLQLAPAGHHFHGYDAKINAGIRVEFQAAAFRYGHSLVPGHIDRYNKFHQRIGECSSE